MTTASEYAGADQELVPPATRRRVGRLELGQFSILDLGLLTVVLIWGVNFAIIKAALADFSALSFAAARFALATVAVVALTWVREGGLRLQWGDFLPVLGLGLLGHGVYQLLFMNGIARTSAGNASLLLATAPMFVALISALMGERLRPLGWMGICLAFAGLTLIIQSGAGAQLGGDHLLGDLLVLGCASAWGAYTALSRPWLKRYSPLQLTALTMLLGTPPLFLVSAPAMQAQDWGAIGVGSWLGLGYSVVFSIVVAYVIWYMGVQKVGGARTAVYSNLVPVVALVTAAVWLGERIMPLQVLGAAVVLVGIVLTRLRR